ncbi:MAG: pentapeptide repeat-containing protein [Deltaproteobacteria bacterium]|jgi:uncharacterized protein YjbI with pentapeptide repeats|nr:pentapeptide repeat-containing protein [Deltaproteobacteria bacterium]
MDIICADPLTITTLNFRHATQDYLAITAMVGFALTGKPALLSQADSLKAAIEALTPFGVSGISLDSGLAKPVGEFLGALTAYAPGGVPTNGLEVGIGVGPLWRRFLVTGEKTSPTGGSPKPFQSLTLGWPETAYNDFSNPYGVKSGVTLGSCGLPLLAPRVLALGATIQDSVSLDPASPLPIPLSPKRSAVSGTYDRKWLLDSWPGFPADFNFSDLNMAQIDQRLTSGYFLGNETIRAVNLHPTRPQIEATLPNRRLRLIFSRKTHQTLYSEVEPVLDTIWLFPDREAGLIIWHANILVTDEKASEIPLIVATLELMEHSPSKATAILEAAQKGFPKAQVLAAAAISDQEANAQIPSNEPEAKLPDSALLEVTLPEDTLNLTPPTSEPQLTPLPLFSAALIASEAKNLAQEALPQINKYLADNKLAPLTIEDLSEHLEKDSQLVEDLLNTAPLDEEGPPSEETLNKLIENMGLSKEQFQNYQKAGDLPFPISGDFNDPALYDAALEEYGSKWAALMGTSPQIGQQLAQNIKQASILTSDQGAPQAQEALASLLFGDNQKTLPSLALESLASDEFSPEAISKLFEQTLAAAGIPKEKSTELMSVLQALDDATDNTAALPLNQKTAALMALAPKLDAALGLAPGYSGQKFSDDFDNLKQTVYGDDELGEALDNLAQNEPHLQASLDELHRLRKLTPPLDCLTDIAKAAGVADVAILAKISILDPLNPPLFPKGISPEPSRDPIFESLNEEQAQNAAQEHSQDNPPQDAQITSREALIKFLSQTPAPTFGALTLAGLDLSGLDFSHRDMDMCDLRYCDLTGCTLSHASLKKAILNNAKLIEAKIDQTDFSQASMVGLVGSSLNFSTANLAGSDLSEAIIEKSDLRALKAPGAFLAKTILLAEHSKDQLVQQDLAKPDLTKADLNGATFSQVNLRGVNFTGANLSQANFYDSDLTDCNFSSGLLFKTSFSGSFLVSALFRHSQAQNLFIQSNCQVMEADFSFCDLSEATAIKASFKGANFTGAIAKAADFTGADLSFAILTGATLRKTVLFRANLSKANIMGADLFKAVLGGANLSGADLSSANLYASDLYRITIDDHTNFSGADVGGTCLNIESVAIVSTR